MQDSYWAGQLAVGGMLSGSKHNCARPEELNHPGNGAACRRREFPAQSSSLSAEHCQAMPGRAPASSCQPPQGWTWALRSDWSMQPFMTAILSLFVQNADHPG